MLADKFNEIFRDNDVVTMLTDLVQDAKRMTISHDVAEHCFELAIKDSHKLPDISPYAVWPATTTWLEFPYVGMQAGIYFYGNENQDVQCGDGLLILNTCDGRPPIMLAVKINLPDYSITYNNQNSSESFQKRIEMTAAANAIIDKLKEVIVTLLILLNSPKITVEETDDKHKINKKRTKAGKIPLFTETKVKLSVAHKLSSRANNQHSDLHGETREHYVRAHLRYLVHPKYKKASIILVSPHKRGNPAKGMNKASYVVE